MVAEDCQPDVAYGPFILNRPPLYVDSIKTYGAPAQLVARLPRITRPGSLISATRYDEKIVEIKGRIVAERRNRATMIMHTDILKRTLETGHADLRVGYPDQRYYDEVRIINEVELDWDQAARGVVFWTARFLANDPLLNDASITTVTDEDFSIEVQGSDVPEFSKTFDLAPGGSAFCYPTITITIDDDFFAITTFILTNNTTEPETQMRVDYAFNNGDILEINGVEMTVKVNGVEVDWSGNFICLDRRLGITNNVTIVALAEEAQGVWELGTSTLGIGTYLS